MAARGALILALTVCTAAALWNCVCGWLCACAITLCTLLLLSLLCKPGTPGHVCVLVLGDVGRSPRMTYHALSLARNGFDVTLAGFRETDPHKDVLNNRKIKIHQMSDFKGVTAFPRICRYAVKVAVQAIQLFYVLMKMDPPSFILLQVESARFT